MFPHVKFTCSLLEISLWVLPGKWILKNLKTRFGNPRLSYKTFNVCHCKNVANTVYWVEALTWPRHIVGESLIEKGMDWNRRNILLTEYFLSLQNSKNIHMEDIMNHWTDRHPRRREKCSEKKTERKKIVWPNCIVAFYRENSFYFSKYL